MNSLELSIKNGEELIEFFKDKWSEYDKNRGGYMLFLYLEPYQYEIIRNIEINDIKDLNKVTSWAPKEYILHKIYEVLPEMFEE